MTRVNITPSGVEVFTKQLVEEDFCLEFLTGRGELSGWQETVRSATRYGGALVQERIFAPEHKASYVLEELSRTRDRGRCIEPLVLASPAGSDLRCAGVVATPRGDRAVLKREDGGFLLSTRDSRLLFGSPVIVPVDGCSNEYGRAFQGLGRQAESSGMRLSDLVRTWIHLKDIGNDYFYLNAARKEYFSTSLPPAGAILPASTAVQGSPYPLCRVSLQGWYAAGNGIMTERAASPLQLEPTQYEVLFSRAVAVRFRLNSLLLISGTAAISPGGLSLHAGDCEAQMKYTLEIILNLLASQNGGVDDIAQSVIYVKDPMHEELCLETAIHAGLTEGRTIVQAADICRDDLLCEVEVHAVIPNRN